MKRTIFPYDFAPYYPVGIQPCPMYVDVANRVYERIKNVDLNLPDSGKLKKEIAINVAIYFEDKMSGIGLWNTFVAKHQLMYFHSLPFFDDFDALDKEDVNAKEVELLIWLVLSRNFDDRFLNPLAMGEDAANLIIEILTQEDEVEVNDGLHDYIYNADKANDYFKLKHVLPIVNKRNGMAFDALIAQLQMGTHVCIADFEYLISKKGEPYGWGVARYCLHTFRTLTKNQR